ncbi:mitochondrial fission process protein 1 [Drosophila subpulchrella]|uniref:mitochondrial fission process protein 1 n=1 Tax=Drosophila subpulchrella TaxID=1486046 RepID=UPI0018A1AB1C|nr:mitochondrial fission process protein 1 [Drosophila subpulchrella]
MPEDKDFNREEKAAVETAFKQPTRDVDIYRDTFIRYMGYSNEIGESFRPLVPKSFVAASYGMAIGYVCTDTFDKALRLQMDGASSREVAIKGGDVFGWQMLASVAIPGLVINRITWATKTLLSRAPVAVLKTVPTLVGLASIPLIIHPIDTMVDRLMDATYRKTVR